MDGNKVNSFRTARYKESKKSLRDAVSAQATRGKTQRLISQPIFVDASPETELIVSMEGT